MSNEFVYIIRSEWENRTFVSFFMSFLRLARKTLKINSLLPLNTAQRLFCIRISLFIISPKKLILSIFRAKQNFWWLTLTKLADGRNDCMKLCKGIWVDWTMLFPRIWFSTSRCKPVVIVRQMKFWKMKTFLMFLSPWHFEV